LPHRDARLRAFGFVLAFLLPFARALAGDGGVIADSGDWAIGTSLYLDVAINGAPTGQLAHFDERDGALWAGASTLRELGFVMPPGRTDPVRIDSLAGVRVEYDAVQQRVAIFAPPRLLDLKTALLNAPENRVPNAESAPGIVLNYDVYGASGKDVGTLASTTELRAFAGHLGVLSSTSLQRLYDVPGDGWHGDSERLDTNWRFAFPEPMLALTIGDTTTPSLSWTRATRIGGIELSRDFALQPYRITTPLPAFFGEATLPSAVDLYVNGVRQYSGRVPAGPFQLTTIPTINGAGLAQIVTTDALGRTTTIDVPLYGTRQLLAAGLSDASIDVGFVRENYGFSSFDYASRPMASASFRRGLTNALTLEAHAEGTSRLGNGGIGGVFQIGNAGIVNASVAASRADSKSGSQFGLGFEWTNGRYSVALDTLRTQGDFADVASFYGLAPPRVSDRAVAGYATANAGTFGVNYLRQQYRGEEGARYGGVYWSRSFGARLSLNITANQNLDAANDRSVFVGVTVAIGERTSASTGIEHNGGRTSASVDVSSPVPGDGGFGWRAQGRSGVVSGGAAEASWLGSAGQISAGASSFREGTYGYADATGALVLMGGHAFAARHIDDAFAVVDASGIADVPVHLENRVVGRTDENGVLLVTRLEAYQRNALSIDPMDLPADMRVERVDAVVTPADRAGALVRFGIARVRAAMLTVRDANGAPIALGSHAVDHDDAVVGYDGALYLEGLDTHNAIDIETPTGRCRVAFDVPTDTTGIPAIGPLTCHATEAL
jgi:outer membrane usher protein